MKIILAGGSGFLGSALSHHLTGAGHDVVILSRRPASYTPSPRMSFVAWDPSGKSGPWASELTGAHAIVNLAGESIAAKRWSPAQKKRILDSRLLATRSLTTAIKSLPAPPDAFISGSAVGFYGDRGDETLTETSASGNDFLADVCRQWEACARDVESLTRVAVIRTGIPLDRTGGALKEMLLPFRMFAGGPFGSGRQYMPWIHRDDWVRLLVWMTENDRIRGPVNGTAPNPVTNREFSKALGHALHRPALLPAPSAALRLMLGEMADALLLSGQRALPVRATDLGFTFRFTNLDAALADILK